MVAIVRCAVCAARGQAARARAHVLHATVAVVDAATRPLAVLVRFRACRMVTLPAALAAQIVIARAGMAVMPVVVETRGPRHRDAGLASAYVLLARVAIVCTAARALAVFMCIDAACVVTDVAAVAIVRTTARP